MNQNTLDALTSAIYLSRLNLRGEVVDSDDKRIRASGLYESWAPGSYTSGDIRNAGGQTWECFQAHDTAVYPDITPEGPSWLTFWRPLHGTSLQTARPWVAPTGAHDIYRAGECMIWSDGTIYHCVSDTSFSPQEYAQAWTAI